MLKIRALDFLTGSHFFQAESTEALLVWMNLQTSAPTTLELEQVMPEITLPTGPILRQHLLSARPL